MLAIIFQTSFSQDKNWSPHFQQTVIPQHKPKINAPYSGDFSLSDSSETQTSLTTTIFIGRKLWKGASVFYNPELAGGSGLSQARGIAGFTNGECFRIGDPKPTIYTARLFFRQDFALSNQRNFSKKVEKIIRLRKKSWKEKPMPTQPKMASIVFKVADPPIVFHLPSGNSPLLIILIIIPTPTTPEVSL